MKTGLPFHAVPQSNGPQSSLNITLAAGEICSVAVSFLLEKCNDNDRLSGTITIFAKGNEYEIETVELIGATSIEQTCVPLIEFVGFPMNSMESESEHLDGKHHFKSSY